MQLEPYALDTRQPRRKAKSKVSKTIAWMARLLSTNLTQAIQYIVERYNAEPKMARKRYELIAMIINKMAEKQKLNFYG